MKFNLKSIFVAAVFALAGLVSCEENLEEAPVGVSNIINSHLNKKASQYGETITIKFDATVAWEASLKASPELDEKGKEWASIASATTSGNAGKACTVRITIMENNASEERKVELWLTLEGMEAQKIATLTQAAEGASIDEDMNRELNTFMHDILKTDYLWVEEYNKLKIDLTVPYSDFLGRHLLSMGDVNIEDGGWYRQTHALSGQKYIYSSLVEVQPVTRAAETAGLGFGPFISTALAEGSDAMALAPSYVRIGSPAEKLGLRRGDLIWKVNGTVLTTSNYKFYMNSLYQNPSGAYNFSYIRFEKSTDPEQDTYVMNSYDTETQYAGPHIFNPVLHASVIPNPKDENSKIGYLVFETFDLYSQQILEEYIDWYREQGITELVLDLRFNVGGAVAQSRWLAGCIAGAANNSKTFCKTVFNDGRTENWTFGNGYTEDTDNLGLPVDLGLSRVYVIGSYNTASASELLVNSLKGIDFDVTLIGSRTEGKNVGMTVSHKEYNGRSFQFQPVTFWVRNAKDDGDYADGMLPEENWIVNNDNSDREDDGDPEFPYSFSDWGNMDFNLALQWAYCDITGIDRWEVFKPSDATAPETSEASDAAEATRSSASLRLRTVDVQPYIAPAGKSGNLVY